MEYAIQLEGYKSLKEGEPIAFDIVMGKKGFQAGQVQRLTGTSRRLREGNVLDGD